SSSSTASSSNASGAPTSYKWKKTFEATAYTGGGTTASGLAAKVGRIAVDPRVIPLGSQLYVSGYGYCVAADTGGAIKGNIVDLYFNTYSECVNFGRKNVTVYLVD
ncbi:MAG: 3D domain-containing protein, partial [Butyricicoccaceae bacterium]